VVRARPDGSSGRAPGPGYREIVRLATPLALANAFALGAQWLIVVLIGRFGTDALYIRSLYLPVSFILAAFQVGIDISTLVAVARHRAAARDGMTDLGRVVRPMAVAGITAIAVAAGVVALGAGPLGHLLGVQPGAERAFVAFIRLMCTAVVLEVPCMILTAALRGSGRAGPASLVAVTVMVIQVAGVAILGGPFGLGLLSLPWAVVASAFGGLALAAAFLHRYGLLAGILRAPAPRPVGGIRRAVATLVGVGVPISGTFVVLFLANVATLRVLANYGEAAVSGYGIANTTQIVVIVPAMGLGTAVAILVNQGGGAAVLVAVRRGAVLAAGLYAMFGALIWIGAGPIARIAAPDQQISGVAATYLRVVGPTLACVGTMLATLTVLEQTGSGFVALAFNCCYFAISIGIGAVLAHRSGSYRPLFDTMAIANVAALVAVAPIAIHRFRRLATAAVIP
jgi:Na+-driven multidrug efflux pump